ncbi:MAG: SPOR domain-containing protein [Alphaproteobacteria bacterium]|nr:SPOR domain-containing protein [Alphaproteobacteria bacterium]
MTGLLAFVLGTAFAGWSVEGPSYTNRSDANDYAKSAKDAGYKGRVIRRFRDGSGWEFVVRVEDLANADEAQQAAESLAAAAQVAAVVLDEEGTVVKRVEASEIPADKGTPAKGEPEGDAPTAAPWYEAVSEAHGAGLAVLSEAERVLVVYTRKLPDGRIARHTYVRRGTDLYLRIERVEGEVVESTTLALGDAAWLTTGGSTKPQDLQRSRETIEKFSPTGIMPIILDVEGAVGTHEMLGSLAKTGKGDVGGVAVDLYAPKGAPTPEVAVGAKDHLVRRITLDGGKRVHEFSKYREVEGVQLPERILSIHDGASEPDQIVVEKIELDGEIPDAWLAAPK